MPDTPPPGIPAHLCDITEVHLLFDAQTGRIASRYTVNAWLRKRRVPVFGTSPLFRLYDRAAVKSALLADFPIEPKFISAEDAFLRAGKPYPAARRRL